MSAAFVRHTFGVTTAWTVYHILQRDKTVEEDFQHSKDPSTVWMVPRYECNGNNLQLAAKQ